jgi:hypothetical protein
MVNGAGHCRSPIFRQAAGMGAFAAPLVQVSRNCCCRLAEM